MEAKGSHGVHRKIQQIHGVGAKMRLRGHSPALPFHNACTDLGDFHSGSFSFLPWGFFAIEPGRTLPESVPLPVAIVILSFQDRGRNFQTPEISKEALVPQISNDRPNLLLRIHLLQRCDLHCRVSCGSTLTRTPEDFQPRIVLSETI